MCLNPEKCTFGVRVGKFLGFYLTRRRMKVNQDKCEVVIQMRPQTSKKGVSRLNAMLTSLNKFILKFAQHTLCFYSLLKKKIDFESTTNYEKEFESFTRTLAIPQVLTRPRPWEVLYMDLLVMEEAVISVLIRETDTNQSPIYFISKDLAKA